MKSVLIADDPCRNECICRFCKHSVENERCFCTHTELTCPEHTKTQKCENFEWREGMKHKSKLLPCPFCGGKPKAFSYGRGSERMGTRVVMHTVSCAECGAGTDGKTTQAVAAEAWNRRNGAAEAVHTPEEDRREAATLTEMLASLHQMDVDEVIALAMDFSERGRCTPVWIQMDQDDGHYYTAVLDVLSGADEETIVAVWGFDNACNVLHIRDYGSVWMAYTLPLKEGGDKC